MNLTVAMVCTVRVVGVATQGVVANTVANVEEANLECFTPNNRVHNISLVRRKIKGLFRKQRSFINILLYNNIIHHLPVQKKINK